MEGVELARPAGKTQTAFNARNETHQFSVNTLVGTFFCPPKGIDVPSSIGRHDGEMGLYAVAEARPLPPTSAPREYGADERPCGYRADDVASEGDRTVAAFYK